MIRRLPFRILFSVLIGVGITWFLIRQIELRQISHAIRQIGPHILLISFFYYVIFVGSKAIRFRELLNIDATLFELFPIFAIHTFWSNFLPFRSGDLSYIYMLKQNQQVSGTKSIASLMIAGVIDLMLMLIAMLISAWFLRDHLTSLSQIAFFILPLIALAGILITLIFAKRSPIQFKTEIPPIRWIFDKIAKLISELTQLRFDLRLMKVFIASIVSLILRFGFQIYLILKMDREIEILPSVYALSFTNVINLFPIQSIGNFGTIEAPFGYALHQFSVPIETALVTAFSLHLIVLSYSVVIGVIGFLIRTIF